MNKLVLLIKRSHIFGWMALLVSVALNCILVAESVRFFGVQSGAFIRPMVWAITCFTIWLYGFVAVVVLSIAAVFVHRTFVLPSIAASLGVVALKVPGLILHLAEVRNGFIVL